MKHRQGGIVIMALLAILAMGAGWFMVSRLSALSADYTIAARQHNAAVLRQAKQALMLYVARQAAIQYESNPGAFLCPEAAGYIGGGDEGKTAGSCTLPAVGRFPWKTIGTEKLLDASGEPLWYVVANGWALPNASSNTVINSNCNDSTSGLACWSGQLTVDGTANAAVALIIAPGQAMNVAASTGCTARNQSRSTPSSTINPLDYIECYNTATSSFSTTGASSSFNDTVVKITAAEILPLIEAAIADRITQEFGAQMKSAYSGGVWASTTVLPFAASFGNPTTSNFKGSSGTLRGLPPLSYAFTGSPGGSEDCNLKPDPPAPGGVAKPCTPIACSSGARCDSDFVDWRGADSITRTGGANLAWWWCYNSGTPTTLNCILATYSPNSAPSGGNSITLRITATADKVGMVLRQINSTVRFTGVDTSAAGVNPPYGYSVTAATLNSDASATLTISTQLPSGGGDARSDGYCGLSGSEASDNKCWRHDISIPMALLSDHPLVDPSNSTYNWLIRNKWHELSYYAIAAGVAPSANPRGCTTGTTCLSVAYHPSDGKQRGVWLIAGAKIGTQARPPTGASDLFEDANADGQSPFALRAPLLTSGPTTASPPYVRFNDRIAVLDSN